MAGKNIGDKIFSDTFTLKSDIGNKILRQSPIGPNNAPAKPVTWVEKGVLKSWANGAGAFPAACCISINEEAVHGIPGPRALAAGDLVSIDVGARVHGWCASGKLRLRKNGSSDARKNVSAWRA